jgi:hypothetical protein
LRTLRDPSLNMICPVKLLLIQALRSGNISSLDNALAEVSRRHDRKIRWSYPDRLVVPQLTGNTALILWDTPGKVKQLNRTTQELASVAGR